MENYKVQQAYYLVLSGISGVVALLAILVQFADCTRQTPFCTLNISLVLFAVVFIGLLLYGIHKFRQIKPPSFVDAMGVFDG